MTTSSSPSIWPRLRSLQTALISILFAALMGCGEDAGSSTASTPQSVVEVVEYGTGPATVVFESGLGDDWQPWEYVAREVSTRALTFAYSRPGYGQSEPSPAQRDALHIVEELRALLASRSLAPPYVLVGHSLGGTYMELFAKAYPEEVSGVVLVEPRHRDFGAACTDAGLEGCAPPPAVLATLPRVQRDELQAFAQASEQIGAQRGFGAYPLRVLTATEHGFGAEVEALWQAMLGSLASEAQDGEQSIFEGAGHYLQLERAPEVSQAILSLLPPAP